MLELSRIITAAGLPIAATGLIVYGMGTAFSTPRDFEMNLGIWMMIIGVVMSIVGIVMYRQTTED